VFLIPSGKVTVVHDTNRYSYVSKEIQRKWHNTLDEEGIHEVMSPLSHLEDSL